MAKTRLVQRTTIRLTVEVPPEIIKKLQVIDEKQQIELKDWCYDSKNNTVELVLEVGEP